MALKVHKKMKFQGIEWKSGFIYTFKYSSWQNDPAPVIILMYAFSGTHPTTGHEWHFFQGINLNYINRAERRRFAQQWVQEMERSGNNVELSWTRVKDRYPTLKGAVRRYFYNPRYYISHAIEIPIDQIEEVVVSTWTKDFSKKVKTSLALKYRKVTGDNSLFGRIKRMF